jgi:diguanylate cyclase (GGDEF)-like protein
MISQTNQVDQLTGFAKRSVFEMDFRNALTEARKSGISLSLALFDIDFFDQINQQFGHHGGDMVLMGVAESTQSILGDQIKAYRYGGDEFAVIFIGIEREQAFLQLERVRLAVEQHRLFGEEGNQIETQVMISGGIAAFPIDGNDESELLRKADGAVYRAKDNGRNKILLAFDERMIPKTAHYTQTQLERLSELAREQEVSEAVLLREALDDLLTKYNHNFLSGKY